VTSCTWNFRLRVGRLGAAIAVAASSLALGLPTAHADQLSSDRAEASALADRISALGLQESALSEQYNAGTLALQQANAQVAAASKQLATDQANEAHAKSELAAEAVESYMDGGSQDQQYSNAPVNLQNANDALLRQEFVNNLASSQSDALDAYRSAVATTALARQGLVAAQSQAQQKVTQLASDRQQVEASAAKLQATEDQVKGQIATLVAQIQAAKERAAEQAAARAAAEQQAAAAAAAARVRQEVADQPAAPAGQPAAPVAQPAAAPQIGGGTSAPPAYTPPSNGSLGARAVAAAESRLGDPYVWAASGPSAFDCSGLVMWAFGQAGVSLPHFSGAQYAMSEHISMSDLQPGDLVFPANPGEHVAMYIGGGQVIQAPYTGTVVQIDPLTSFFVYAGRIS
jgi:cell wall-associated NlpC family hydrolase